MNNDDDAGGEGERAAGGEVGGDGRSEFRERGGGRKGESYAPVSAPTPPSRLELAL